MRGIWQTLHALLLLAYCVLIILMKIIITYYYGLGFLIQLNISEKLNFYQVVYLLNPHEKLYHCLLSGRHICVIGFVHYIYYWRKLPPQIEEFSERERQTGDIGSTFYQKWWIISSVSGHFKLFLYPKIYKPFFY